MAIASDFTINTTWKTIRHTSGTTVYTVNELYTYLLDYFDETSTIKYDIPMSAQTPTIYSLINGWFIDDASFHYLKTGAIGTPSGSWNGEVYVLYFQSSGYTSAQSADIGLTVHDSGSSHTGTLLDFDNTLRKWWVRKGSGTFANSDALTITTGTGAGTVLSSDGVFTGEMQYSCIFTLGSLVSGTTLDVYQNDVQITPWWSAGHIDILVKVMEVGTEIDTGNVTVLARKYNTLYDHYVIDASSGRNPVPLAAFTDKNNQNDTTTVSGYNDITITFGATSQDVGNENGNQPYDVAINCLGHTLQEVYEYLKYVTRTGSSDTLNGVNGEYYIAVGDIRLDYTSEASGPFVETSAITSSSGGSGYIVSLIDNGTTGTLVIRNVHGTFSDTDTITSGSTTATINGEPEAITPSKQAPFGTFAGGNFFGARGVWIYNMDSVDANNYSLIDSLGVTQTPFVSVPISINGVEVGDKVSVFRASDTSGTINKTYLHSDSSANSSGSTTYTVDASTPIPVDTPSEGFIRLVKASTGAEERIAYSGWTGLVFSLSSAHGGGYGGSDTAYVPYLDDMVTSGTSLSTNVTYTSDRYISTRVRQKGIVPFIVNTIPLNSNGYSATAIRIDDSIA